MNPYETLANAIVLQAVKDYRYATKRMKNSPTAWSAKNLKEDAERFFLSDWFTELTDADGAYILTKLKEEVEG